MVSLIFSNNKNDQHYFIMSLPMLECSSCGQYVGHLYEDYFTLTKKLIDELEHRDVPSMRYITSLDKDITEFIQNYYTWYDLHKDEEGVLEYLPGAIVSRALLNLEITPLPFGKHSEPDGQHSPFEARPCCLRMLQTNPV